MQPPTSPAPTTARRTRAAAATIAAALGVIAAPAAAQGAVAPLQPATAQNAAALWTPGFPVPLRLQILIDQTNLAAALGRPLLGFQLHRKDHDRDFQSGDARWSVTVGVARGTTAAARRAFDANVDPASRLSFALLVHAPASPRPAASSLTWAPNETITVPFPAPFPYGGGTLCIEITGAPVATAPTTAWPMAATTAPQRGLVATIGPGCGPFGRGVSAFVEADTLVPGATARFSSFGLPGSFALMAIGAPAPGSLALEPLGSAPGCAAHVTGVLGAIPALYGPPVFLTDPSIGGMATATVQLPNANWVLGATLGSQWFDFAGPAFTASNAHAWTVATSLPALGMAVVMAKVEGALPSAGEVVRNIAPYVRVVF